MNHENDAYGFMHSLRLRRENGEFGIPLTPEQRANLALQQADIDDVRRRYLEEPSPLYLQQMGRVLRPKGWRWRNFKVGFFNAVGWPFAGSSQRLAFALFMFILIALVACMGWDASR